MSPLPKFLTAYQALKAVCGSFIFTLQEYARELISLVDAMNRICSIERANAASGGLWGHIKSFFCCGRRSAQPGRQFGRGMRHKDLRKRFCKMPAF